jgi:hypothetical protein
LEVEIKDGQWARTQEARDMKAVEVVEGRCNQKKKWGRACRRGTGRDGGQVRGSGASRIQNITTGRGVTVLDEYKKKDALEFVAKLSSFWSAKGYSEEATLGVFQKKEKITKAL